MSDRPRWQVPVLVLAILLVVGQVVVYFALRGGSKDSPRDAGPVARSAALPQGSAVHDAEVLLQPQAPVLDASALDASTEVSTPDATVEQTSDPVTETTVVKKKVSRAELLAQKKKEREEQQRIAEVREVREAQQRKADAEKAAAEKARVDAELEKQRLATRKAEAEAAEAKAAAEKARIEALARDKPVEPLQPAVTAKAPDVLVLVLGPGTPSLSSDQIRAVFLGNTSVWPNGTTARPFNRPGGTPAARKFYGGVLRMSAGDFREHWSEVQLAGNGIPPPLAGSGANAVAKVAATQGGFTYVMESELPSNTNGVRLVRLK
jgi:hypothetical protein